MDEKKSFHFYIAIKVLSSFYKFQQDLLNQTRTQNNKRGKLILLDKTWFSKYKTFYFYDELIKLIKQYNLSNLEYEEQKILFNNLFKKFRQRSSAKMILFYDKKEEFPEIINYQKEYFLKDFEIINEEIYKNLKFHKGDFNISFQDNIIYSEYNIYNGKMMIKYINDDFVCYNLFIGSLNEPINSNNCFYNLEISVYFENKGKLENEFNGMDGSTCDILHKYTNLLPNNILIDLTQNLISETKSQFNYNKVKYIINKENIKDHKQTLSNKGTIKRNFEINSENIINFFIELYSEYEDLKEKIKNVQYRKEDFDYFIINKNWIHKFKDAYKYSELKKESKNNYINKSDISNLELIKNKIEVYNKKNDILIYNLSNINLNFINYDYCETSNSKKDFDLKYYKDFELWRRETYNSFLNIGFKIENEPKLVKCYFDKNYIFILYNNNLNDCLNIYQLSEENNNFNFEPIMAIKCNDMKEIKEKIINGSFFQFIYSLNSQNNRIFPINKYKGIAYLLNERDGKINDKIKKKNKRIDFIVNLLVSNEEIKNKTNKTIKENLENNNNNKEEFYLIHRIFIDEYLKQSGLYETYKNPNYKQIIGKDNMSIEEKKSQLKNYFTSNNDSTDQIEEISNISSAIFEPEKKYQITDYIIVRNHNEYIYYYNDYYLITEDTLDIVNNKIKYHLAKFNCLIGNKKILFLSNSGNKTIIQIGYLNNRGIFLIEAIVHIFNNYEKIINEIINLGYLRYFQNYFVFQNEDNEFANISPFFDQNQKIQGYGYKINNSFKKNIDFSDFTINNILLKVIYLIIYFSNIKKFLLIKEHTKYYLINKSWIETFIDRYYYEKVKMDISQNIDASKLLNIINNNIFKINNKNGIKEFNKDLLSKKIYALIKNISETNKFFNDNQKNMENIDSTIREPVFESYNYLNGENFTIFNNFILMDKNIFELIFDIQNDYAEKMEFKNNFCDCYYVEEYMFIKLNKLITGSNKIIFEVGHIDDSNNTFILEYLILYPNNKDFEKHFKYLKTFGIKKNFKDFQSNSEGLKSLQIEVEILDYINKNGKNPSNNSNNIITNNNFGLNYDKHKRIVDNYIPIRKQFSKAPQIGLQNVGATCYMNATIQCFGQIEKLVDHFKSYSKICDTIENYKIKREDCLTEAFKYLIENLWPTNIKYNDKKYNLENTNNKYFVPKLFKERISKMNTLFEGAKANDSKDLVNFIIMRLHEELNEGKKYENNNAPSQENELSMFNYFKESTKYENKSIISDLFYGINGTVYECSKCHTRKYNFQIGFFYIFPLEEVRKFKIQLDQNSYMQNLQFLQMQMNQNFPYMNNMNMNLMPLCFPFNANAQNKNSVTIKDCFDYNQKIERMEGENSMYCNKCNTQEPANYQSYIVEAPEIIIIILNRGKGIEFNVKLEFDEFLSINQYVKNNDGSYNYRLIGVVTHLGESGASGHFIAYCLSPVENQWYNYNDDLCFPVTKFKEQVIDYAMPYILFYQKIKNNNSLN